METGVTSSMKSAASLLTKLKENLPQSPMMWIVALTCIVLLVTLSRMLAIQRSIQDLQAKPGVDESVVRQLVRQQLEETVKSIEQQNKAHMQMHSMRAQEAARQATEARREPTVTVEVVTPPDAKAVDHKDAKAVETPDVSKTIVADALIDEKLDDDVPDAAAPIEKTDRRRKK